MAYANKTITNSRTGQIIRFVKTAKDTGGQLLEMEATFSAYSSEPVAHYHPRQVEDFRVVSGKLTVRIDGQVKNFRAGDRFHIAKNTVHSMWNQTGEPTVVNWQVTPAMDTEYFLETTTGLANDGKTNANGVPSLLQTSLLMNRYARVFQLTQPSPFIRKIVFSLLTPVACLLGYKSRYPKYLD
ncbi:hypothetical protein GCM10027347_28050 [Larkinella harenae]